MSLEDLVPHAVLALEPYHVPRASRIEVKLDANESPFPLRPELAEELGRELGRVALHRYPDGGADELRHLLAGSLSLADDQLCLGNGSDELIGLIVAAFSRPRSSGVPARVLLPTPTFSVYRMAAVAHGAEPVEVPLRVDFSLDAEALERAVEATRPNVIFLALPNNPTGTLWPRADVARLVERHPDVLIVADEAYGDYAGETFLDLLPRHENLVVLRTLSKIGLAALRVGCLVGRPELIAQVDKLRPPYNLGALNQAAARWWLYRCEGEWRAQVAVVVCERETLVGALAAVSGIQPFPTRANHVLFRCGRPGDGKARTLFTRLRERGVLVRCFDRPGPLSGCLRATVGTPAENARLVAEIGAVWPEISSAAAER